MRRTVFIWLELLLLGLVTLAIGAVLIFMISLMPSIHNQTAAAWVQAVGSVGAVLIAIGIAVWQRKEDKRLLARTAQESRKKALHVACVAAGLIRDSISDLSAISRDYTVERYRDGMIDRMRDQRDFLAALRLDDLTATEIAAIARVRDACSAGIALLVQPVGENTSSWSAHISQTAAEFRSRIDVEIKHLRALDRSV